MALSIALVQLPHFYSGNNSRPPESYPLGLGYISSALKENNIAPVGIDLWGLQYGVQEALSLIDYKSFNYIGISAYSTQYKYLKELTLGLKEKYPQKPIICGGPGPTFNYEIILRNTGVDVCVVGEGDATIVELLNNFDNLNAVKGIAYLNSGAIVSTPNRDYIKDIDSLKFPDRTLFDLNKIISTANLVRAASNNGEVQNKFRKSADIIAGRGCPFDCNYCSKTFKGVRLRSVNNFIAEVEGLITDYGINHLLFNDELALINRKRTLQLCARLKRLRITWSCQGRIDQVDEEILNAMKDSGCIQLGYGVESASQSILDNMNKKQDVNKIIPVINLTKKIGIEPIIQYMYGYPGETNKTISNTVKFFKKIDHLYIGFTTTLMPGTRLYNQGIEKGLIKDEEKYLLQLDSGYNISVNETLINLTGFTNKEFFWKKRMLELKVNHNYYKKRPILYINFLVSILKLFRSKIMFFIKKVLNENSNIRIY